VLPFGLIGEWSPGIGDPTFVGWLTVAAYFATAWLCWKSLRRSCGARGLAALRASLAGLRTLARPRRAGPGLGESAARLDALWLCLSALMLFLGVNKQLDLQSAVTAVGRILAHGQGWYDHRHAVQAAFIVVVGLSGLAGLGAVALLARGHFERVRLALLGMVFLVAFVLIRASSFHHMDALIRTEVAGARMNWVLELGGIACVAASAWRSSGLPSRPRGRADA
jgi:hypothetical protein